MKVTYNNIEYECRTAVKCEDDKYIKLYDSNSVEIIAFYDIDDFSLFKIEGYWLSPCDCQLPIILATHSIGGRTITPSAWKSFDNGQSYYYQIKNSLISANETTCNILILFDPDTEIDYDATQAEGVLTLFVDTKPIKDIAINGIHVTRT